MKTTNPISDCEKCATLMEMRLAEGAQLRRIAEEIGQGFSTKHARILNEIADELECGNPLGDCGCEGTCFTGGDS